MFYTNSFLFFFSTVELNHRKVVAETRFSYKRS